MVAGQYEKLNKDQGVINPAQESKRASWKRCYLNGELRGEISNEPIEEEQKHQYEPKAQIMQHIKW